MAIDPLRDAYRILQVDPAAHQDVIRAAYYALARLYHPDGATADEARMAELSRAYDQVRNPTRRRKYDQSRLASRFLPRSTLSPVGPGPAQPSRPGQPSPASSEVSATAGPFARARPAVPAESDGHRLDFGRYVGWLLRDLVYQDPDYLRWLSRHSSGIRFRGEIQRLLPGDGWESKRVPVPRGGRS